MKKYILILLCLLTNSQACLAQGYIVWNESLNGPISGDYTVPTYMGQWQEGINTIIGETENEPTGSSWYVHGDYFRFIIPPSFQITSAFLTIDNQRTSAWIGSGGFSEQLGFAANATGGNLLSQWGLSSIGPGNYFMYMENGDRQAFTTIANYRLDFILTPVPEPSAWALLALGGAAFACFRWRRRS
jgi:hypothetical protein